MKKRKDGTMESQYRNHQGDDQMELFPLDPPLRNPRWPLVAAIVAVVVAGMMLFAPLLARAEEQILTHACYAPDKAADIANVMAIGGAEDYYEVTKKLLDSGDCVWVKVDGPSPLPPLYTAQNGDFIIGVFRGNIDGRPVFILLMNDYRNHPNFAEAI